MKKKYLNYFIGFILIGFILNSAFAKALEAVKIQFSDPQKAIIVKKSAPVFSIVMQSNPTTGYSWALKNYDPDLIQVVSRHYYPATSGLIGAGGYEKWLFKVKPEGFTVPQVTSIMLIYQRPWEVSGAQVTNFKVVTTDAN